MPKSENARLLLAVTAMVLAVLTAACRPQQQQTRTAQLPSLEAKLAESSVSGISSGAYMAGQFQLAHGEIVIGTAIIAGGPYACAESLFADVIPGPGMMLINMGKAVNGCMLNTLWMMGIPNPKMLARRARQLAERGDIAPLDTVTSDRVYLFSGAADTIVRPPIVAAARDFYRELGLAAERIAYVENAEAGHAFVTLDAGGACGRSEKPYVVDCDYDQAGALLAHIYGKLSPRTEKPGGMFLTFDQREFASDLGDHGLADTGVAYVPEACRIAAGCRVHVSFHGCAQSRSDVGDAYITGTALAQWADTNRLIVLFPQVRSGPTNPQGCWDWWGYTGQQFLTRRAPQIIAVRRMLDRLSARPGAT